MYEQGIYRLLSGLPTWIAMGSLCVMVLLVLSEKISRRERMVAHMWAVCYAGVLVVVLFTIGILKHGTVFVPNYYLQFGWCHWLILSIAMAFGVSMCLVTNENRLAELFRDVIVDPLFVFLIITLLPIVYTNGTNGDKTVTSVCVLIWIVPFLARVVLGLRRFIEGRLQSRSYHVFFE